MKKRQKKEVKTETLIILLTVFTLAWAILLMVATGLNIKTISFVLGWCITSIISSFITVSVIALIFNWKI